MHLRTLALGLALGLPMLAGDPSTPLIQCLQGRTRVGVLADIHTSPETLACLARSLPGARLTIVHVGSTNLARAARTLKDRVECVVLLPTQTQHLGTINGTSEFLLHARALNLDVVVTQADGAC